MKMGTLPKTNQRGRISWGFAFLPSLFLSLSIPLPSLTAAASPLPAIEPGRLEQRLQPLPQPGSKPATPAREPLKVQPSEADGKIRFTLRDIRLDGNETLSSAHFEELWRDRIGREVSLAEIREIARQITARYRAEGYILSQAVVPVQKIEEGSVAIAVIEGFVSQVNPEEGKEH